MNFTSREEYGLRAVMRLAMSRGDWPVQSREIAKSEAIPEQFLDQVLGALRRAGIVRSIRGASGGYELARAPHEITPGDVVRALSGEIMPIQCLDEEPHQCDKLQRCVVVDLWQKVRSAISQVLDGTTVQALVEERARRDQQAGFMMHI